MINSFLKYNTGFNLLILILSLCYGLKEKNFTFVH